MSGFVVVLSPSAEADIRDAFFWYRERNALVSDAFRAEVIDVIDRLTIDPLKHPADEDGHRKRVLRRFPFSVFYDVTVLDVTVLAVAHHRRRPGYWQR